MAATTVSALAATTKGGKTVPLAPLRPLNRIETASVILLMTLGTVLVVGVLGWFVAHDKTGGLTTKSITTTGSGASQVVQETDYTDTVLIFALTAGAAFVLSGALYGRLRDITLGGVKLTLSDSSEDGAGGDGTSTPGSTKKAAASEPASKTAPSST